MQNYGGFCELTGLYWAWKNIAAKYIGIVHYRRYFRTLKISEYLSGGASSLSEDAIGTQELEELIAGRRVLVPKKRYYYIESLYSHYAHTHYAGHLDLTRDILNEKYPKYVKSYDRTVRRMSGHMFNIMVMERKLLGDYCEWLFDILFELEKRVDTSGLSAYHRRLFGRVGEILFNAWLDYEIADDRLTKNDIQELPVRFAGDVDLKKKYTAFLKAKFLHIKYTSGF